MDIVFSKAKYLYFQKLYGAYLLRIYYVLCTVPEMVRV